MRIEDKLAKGIGTWKFVLGQTIFIVAWVIFNLTPWAFDPFPFIFLNLMLSLQATYTVPILMIHEMKMEKLDREMIDRDRENTQVILRSIRNLEKNLITKIEEIDDDNQT